jgi:hypothetical protein
MISVVICSINPDLLTKLRTNISTTIGVKYELIVIDNTISVKGIAAVYNQGVLSANYDILCFVHEDVVFHSTGWGLELKKIFQNTNIGLVGGFGTIYKSKYGGTWASCHSSLYRINPRGTNDFNNTFDNSNDYDFVQIVDGAFMCTTKKVFTKYQFNDKLLSGFHCYDIDYSLQVGQSFDIIVSNKISIEHLSLGVLNQKWLNETEVCHKYWRNRLPVGSFQISKNYKRYSDYTSLITLLGVYLKYPGYSKKIIKVYSCIILKYPDLNKFLFLKTIIKYLIKYEH